MQLRPGAVLTAAAFLCLTPAVAQPESGTPAVKSGRGSGISTNCPEKLLPAPRQVAPRDDQVLTPLPHTTKFAWTAVRGARHYGIEIDCFLCCSAESWCSESGEIWHFQDDLTAPGYEYTVEKARTMRWRVWARDRCSRKGTASGWWKFELAPQAQQ